MFNSEASLNSVSQLLSSFPHWLFFTFLVFLNGSWKLPVWFVENIQDRLKNSPLQGAGIYFLASINLYGNPQAHFNWIYPEVYVASTKSPDSANSTGLNS